MSSAHPLRKFQLVPLYSMPPIPIYQCRGIVKLSGVFQKEEKKKEKRDYKDNNRKHYWERGTRITNPPDKVAPPALESKNPKWKKKKKVKKNRVPHLTLDKMSQMNQKQTAILQRIDLNWYKSGLRMKRRPPNAESKKNGSEREARINRKGVFVRRLAWFEFDLGHVFWSRVWKKYADSWWSNDDSLFNVFGLSFLAPDSWTNEGVLLPEAHATPVSTRGKELSGAGGIVCLRI
jgi:hypothetical protein